MTCSVGIPNNRGMNAAQFVNALGGTADVALLAKVRPSSVSEWKSRDRIPPDKLIRLAPVAEARGLATRKELFPDDWHLIWPELALVGIAPAVPVGVTHG